MDGMVRLEAVTKVYREGGQERVVLDRLCAGFPRGTFVSIRGRSGSGKSTLLNLISGIDHPTEGVITIDGFETTAMDANALARFRRQHIGFVFQLFNLIPTLTVMENVSLPGELSGRDPQSVQASASDLLSHVGLSDRGQDFPDRLSGGEQQRVAIARALVHQPLLVLADEPTGNLDMETGELVLDLLESMTRSQGGTLILVTHSHQIAGRADLQFQLEGGTLRGQSRVNESLSSAAD